MGSRARRPVVPHANRIRFSFPAARAGVDDPAREAAHSGGKPLRRAADFVAIDFETANVSRDSACAVGLVRVAGGRIVATAAHLIRPPTPEFRFTYIHGLTWADVVEAEDFGALWPTLSAFLDGAAFLAAHNASFDRSVLAACCARYGVKPPPLPFRCTVQISREAWGIFPTRLSDVCRELGIALNHHEALSDAMACARIMIAAEKLFATVES